MRRTIRWNIALTSLIFAACVTINVYFPAAAAEKAADQIIDKVTSGPGSAAPAPAKPTAPPSTLLMPAPGLPAVRHLRQQPALARLASVVLDAVIPVAYAQAEANIDISSAETRAITASMQARFEQLEKYFAAGAVGLTNGGLVEMRDAASVPLAERAVVKRLVAEDNRDRNALYAEIARANGNPDWEADIRRIFARRWVDRGARAGWYYQNASGAWVQK